jgi:predicted methyltransferase
MKEGRGIVMCKSFAGYVLLVATVVALPAASAAAKIPAYVVAAVADPDRPAEDKARDADRKPAECIAFAGIKPGDKVADLIPGKGYFTKIFARVVGPKGWVYAFYPSEIDAIYARRHLAVPPPDDPRYANVSSLHGSIARFTAPERLDVVWTSQNYHDLHDKFFGPVDITAFNKAVFAALKPGGTFIVLDHVAQSGSGLRDTDTLHRIDPAAVKTEVEAVGFKFVGESDVLHNSADPHTAAVFDKSIRGRTDQFIFKFRKP